MLMVALNPFFMYSPKFAHHSFITHRNFKYIMPWTGRICCTKISICHPKFKQNLFWQQTEKKKWFNQVTSQFCNTALL